MYLVSFVFEFLNWIFEILKFEHGANLLTEFKQVVDFSTQANTVPWLKELNQE